MAIRRRQFIRYVGYGAALTTAAGIGASLPRGARRRAATKGAGNKPADFAPVTDEATAAFLGPIAPGATLGRWTVVAAQGVTLGGIAILLSDELGRRFQVDVLRRDAEVPGIAQVGEISVYVSNAGDGARATIEEQGLGAIHVADRLAERAGAAPPALLTLRERNRQFPGGVFHVVT
jgi:hypothetical protein